MKMSPVEIAELVSVLEEEIAVGEKLARNLDAQRQAIAAWHAAALLEDLEVREIELKSLALLEHRRLELLAKASSAGEPVTLRWIIAGLAADDGQRLVLSNLRDRIRGLFTRLSAEEKMLRKLMENLLSHIQDALLAFPEPGRPIYDGTGLARTPDDRLGLYHNKA